MTAAERRAHLDVLQAANRALNDCWIYDRPPTAAEGLHLHTYLAAETPPLTKTPP